ncbi:uncharacterized protein LOC112058219 [Bicyclus anynana]|uniref:Uncharacterized protein LOC112058219 n=1 Tax=Bicyclus anynana TaxID=110368 RepID=A0ABM3LHS0_BICAN|nr:uncharacterized protein LOC112058219 [Bicyclus anynana]
MMMEQQRARLGPLPGGRYLGAARPRLGLALDVAACEPPANIVDRHYHLTGRHFHHPHQRAWLRQGPLGPNLRSPPLGYRGRNRTDWLPSSNVPRVLAACWFIQRSNIFNATELGRLRREAVPEVPASSAEQIVSPAAPVREETEPMSQDLHAEEEDTEGTVSLDIERMGRILEETISEIRNAPLEDRPRLSRIALNIASRDVIEAINEMLPQHLAGSTGLDDTASILFGAALAVHRFIGIKTMKPGRPGRSANNTKAEPAWKRRIERRITLARGLIGRLLCFRSGNRRPRIVRSVRIALTGSGLECPAVCSTSPQPNPADLIAFWRNIWSREVEHDEGPWISAIEETCAAIRPMNPVAISTEDVVGAVRRAANWKSPGPDGLHHYWLKAFSTCHVTLARQFQEALEQGTLPNLFTTGITHLAPKTTDTIDPSKYRPITCLTTIYKTLTSVLSSKITRHVEDNNIMSGAQNGCRGGSRGTKELLLIDSVAGQLVKRNRRNFAAAWIDYKKAFDSVPHSWLLRDLELYKIDCTVQDFLRSCMGQWSTILCLHGERLADADDRIRIRRGIFQGDCLSPLWFCMALNPLSTLLEGSGTGFQFRRGGTKVPHLLYMDDLKLLAPNATRLQELLNLTTGFSNSIRMELGLDKCAVLLVERGQVTHTVGINPDLLNIKTLSETESYRYLGMSQSIGVQEADMKQSVCEGFYRRLTKICKSYLSGANKIRAYNGWVMPVLMYTFGVLRWTQTELDVLDRRVRTTMTLYRKHHPKSSVMRLYVPRKCGGRGLLSAKTMHNREICNLRTYFETKRESPMHTEVIASDKGFTPLSLANSEWQKPVVQSISDRETVWKGKELHGRFFKALHEPHVSKKASVQWLRFGDLFGETEGFVFAIQDQVVKTRNYRKYILKDGTHDICRACRHPGESLRHVFSGCSALANTEYLHRHNQAAKILHQELALTYGLLDQRLPYYKYTPVPVLERDGVRLYWDRSIITDRTILANKPDIVVLDRAQSRVFLVDITIPYDENLVRAERAYITYTRYGNHPIGYSGYEYGGYDGHSEYYAYPKYSYDYSVKDPHTGDFKTKWETRDGDVVKGAYSVADPDGTTRIVEYTADKHNGFNAVVKRIGHSYHPQVHSNSYRTGFYRYH